MVDKCPESIYLPDKIEVSMKQVSEISNVTVVQKEKIVTTTAKSYECMSVAYLHYSRISKVM